MTSSQIGAWPTLQAPRRDIDNCPDTVDSLKDEVQAAQKDLFDDDAMDEATRRLTVTYSLPISSGGQPPIRQPWENVLKVWNFSTDTDRFVFNEKNTRQTIEEALNKDQKRKGTRETSADASECICIFPSSARR